ncbi:DUF4255 domain-containing protein [Dyella flagellata]|uniref:Pvc16 N-terminal domain-containing protein n=1 Tax=Dyella flagellata TaxID=1867833 RepID=A0ABQ5XHA6_9GAMM|nr:DUF4255 domain-containing protein [Dyella flagellata]GLQ89908.1 hypothetical protein GCM10007898_34830 [Dyella flagellata]
MYQAIHATSISLKKYLGDQIKADTFLYATGAPYRVRGMDVYLNTPKEMEDNSLEGISLWLYRVVRDDQRLNDPPVRISPNALKLPPLPLRLHYLVTPLTLRTNKGDPDTEQYLLGKAMQCLHSHAVFRGTDLQQELSGTAAELHVRLESLALEELTRVWDALEGSYQLSVSYEVSVVNIDTAISPEPVTPVLEVVPRTGVIVGVS